MESVIGKEIKETFQILVVVAMDRAANFHRETDYDDDDETAAATTR